MPLSQPILDNFFIDPRAIISDPKLQDLRGIFQLDLNVQGSGMSESVAEGLFANTEKFRRGQCMERARLPQHCHLKSYSVRVLQLVSGLREGQEVALSNPLEMAKKKTAASAASALPK